MARSSRLAVVAFVAATAPAVVSAQTAPPPPPTTPPEPVVEPLPRPSDEPPRASEPPPVREPDRARDADDRPRPRVRVVERVVEEDADATSAGDADDERAGRRPEGYTIGIGAGYVFPASIERPEVVSVRFRLGSGLTFEPVFVAQAASDSTSAGGVDSESSTLTFDLGTNVRWPLHTRGAFDLLLVGGASFGYSSTDPDGSDNDTDTLAFRLAWGLGVDWWVNRHWTIGFTATNPLVGVTATTQQQPFGGEVEEQDTSFGIVFDPTVTLLVHLYY